MSQPDSQPDKTTMATGDVLEDWHHNHPKLAGDVAKAEVEGLKSRRSESSRAASEPPKIAGDALKDRPEELSRQHRNEHSQGISQSGETLAAPVVRRAPDIAQETMLKASARLEENSGPTTAKEGISLAQSESSSATDLPLKTKVEAATNDKKKASDGKSSEATKQGLGVKMIKTGEGADSTAQGTWFGLLPFEIRLRIMKFLDEKEKVHLRRLFPELLYSTLEEAFQRYQEPTTDAPEKRTTLSSQVDESKKVEKLTKVEERTTYFCSYCRMAHTSDFFSGKQQAVTKDAQRICRPIEGGVFLAPNMYLGWKGASVAREQATEIFHLHYIKRPDEVEPDKDEIPTSGPKRNWDHCWLYSGPDWNIRRHKNMFRVQFDPGYRDYATLKMVIDFAIPYIARYRKAASKRVEDERVGPPLLTKNDVEDWELPLCPHLSLTSQQCLDALRAMFERTWYEPVSAGHSTWLGVELDCSKCSTKIDFRWHSDSKDGGIIHVGTIRHLGILDHPLEWEWESQCITKSEERVGRIWKDIWRTQDSWAKDSLSMDGKYPRWLFDYLKGTQYEEDCPLVPEMQRLVNKGARRARGG